MPSEIYKFDSGTWRPIAELQYMDGVTPRTLTEVHYNDSGTWRQVFGAAVAPVVPAWSPTPNGSYSSTDNASPTCLFTINTDGTYNFSGGPVFSGTPLNGTYRPNSPDIDVTNYEYRFIVGTVTGFGTVAPDPGDTVINSTWTI